MEALAALAVGERDILALGTARENSARSPTELNASTPHGGAVRHRGASASHASPFQSARDQSVGAADPAFHVESACAT
mgnify:CR=1 FL=1